MKDSAKESGRRSRSGGGRRRGRKRERMPQPVPGPDHLEIVMNIDKEESRVAILEDHRLVELLVERDADERVLGNIYKGRVSSVLPGMQAAFVDIGLERNGFLHFSDVFSDPADMDTDFGDDAPQAVEAPTAIDDVLQKGQEVVVQVTKEPIGTKGPRVTMNVSIPGRYLVLMPGVKQIGVSKRIDAAGERKRVRAVLEKATADRKLGFIVRTAAEGRSDPELEADALHLCEVWDEVEKRSKGKKGPRLLNRESGITSSLIRDVFTADVNSLVVDSKGRYDEIVRYVEGIAPELVERITHYQGEIPVFDCYDIESELDACLNRQVELPHGGYLGIDHTEALVAIDVNTGRYTGKKNPEETILRTNLEAAREIPRQLRLRDVGGIIVIDFIDMEKESNKDQVLRELRRMLQRDRSRTKTLKVSDMGLVEMTRKRVGPSLIQRLSNDCPSCNGLGRVLSKETVAVQVERGLERATVYLFETAVAVRVHPQVAAFLRDHRRRMLSGFKRRNGLSVEVVADDAVSLSEYRIVSRETGRDITEAVHA